MSGLHRGIAWGLFICAPFWCGVLALASQGLQILQLAALPLLVAAAWVWLIVAVVW